MNPRGDEIIPGVGKKKKLNSASQSTHILICQDFVAFVSPLQV